MIAKCPRCGVRYRIAREKLTPEGVRLRCGRCEAVFRVRPPAPTPDPVAAAPPEPIPQSQPASAPEQPDSNPQSTAVNPEWLVLVAMPDEELAKQTASALEERRLRTAVVHDGVEAMLEVQRQLPRVVVLSASLPKMYGFQICEVMKRNQSLRSIPVVLAGAIHHTDRYRREPNELYGADAYLEDPDLPDGLIPILERLGVLSVPAPTSPAEAIPEPPPLAAPAGPAEADPEPAPFPAASPQPAAAVAASPQPAAAPEPPASEADDGLAEERTKAARLARIIVSDIVLYNEDKFTEAARRGAVVEAMEPDLQEGRGLFQERIDERVREERDYLVEELLRVARLRAPA